MNKRIREIGKNPYFWLVFMTSLLFGSLYIRFILGDYAYMYLDMGSDNFDINYPLFRMFSDVFHGKGYSSYSLQAGLGMDISSYFYQYFNPLNMLVVLLPSRLIPWGILLATYLKLLLLSVFSFRLFEKWTNHVYGSFVGAFVWTFSSYIMLWGQHYGFCTSAALFTVFLYLVHLYVEEDEKSRNPVLVLWVTLMMINNYYFTYMSGLIGAFYIIIYLLFQKKSPKIILKRLLGLLAMGLLGISVGGIAFVSIFHVFTGSARAGAINSRYLAEGFLPYSPQWLYSFVARFFSNNTLGIADDYTGKGNYYEVAMLFTSSLFYVSLPGLLSRKETRRKTAVLAFVSVLALILPISGRIFTMNMSTQRWSFILCFLEAAAIAFFVKQILTERDKKQAFYSVGISVVFVAAALFLLYRGQSLEYFQVEPVYLLITVVFFVGFCLLILGNVYLEKLAKAMPFLMTALLFAELLLANFPSINFRESPTRGETAVSYYNDGSRLAASLTGEEETSVFRCGKTFESGSYNDGMAQGYNGMSVYMSTNPAPLISLKNMYGAEGVSDNFVSFPPDRFILNSLLGMKYLMAQPQTSLSLADYTFVSAAGPQGQVSDLETAKQAGGVVLYRNNYALPFGYLYDQVWEKEEICKMKTGDRALAALSGFYFTEEKGETSYEKAERTEGSEISLVDRDFQAVDCQAEKKEEGIVISDMAADPNIVFTGVEELFGEGPVQSVTIDLEVDKKTDMALYYMTEGQQNFSQDQLCIFKVNKKRGSWTGTLPHDVTALRLDVSTEIDSVTVKDIRLNDCTADNAAYRALMDSKVTDISWQDNTYRASVDNDTDHTKMLCVPLLCQKGFHAYLNGEETALYNINSGLCGVEIPPGSYEVSLQYEEPYRAAGFALSAAGIIVYILWILWGIFRNKGKI